MSIYVKDADGNRKKVAGIGLPGPAGKSAYQYAVEGGFSGTEDEFKALMGVRSNPNLLHNWYFLDPINQLGQEEYTGIRYTIDRWAINGLTVTLEDGWIKLENQTDAMGFFVQNAEIDQFKALIGKSITLSLLYKTATSGCILYCGYAPNGGAFTPAANSDINANNDDWGLVYCTAGAIPNIDATQWQCAAIGIPPGGVLYAKAAKLEEGPVQTLAHKEGDDWVLNDPPPDKALELAKCQRYMLVYKATGGQVRYCSGISYDGHNIFAEMPLAATMRANPSIITSGDFALWNGGNPIPVKLIIILSRAANIVNIDAYTESTIPNGMSYQLIDAASANSQLIFDANL